MKRDQFTEGYIECAVWASTDDTGTPLDGLDADLDTETITKLEADAAKFQSDNATLLEQADKHQNRSRQGHDFWLTRNSHGAGFWDGDYPKELGEALTKASKAFGECNLYVGDDQKIYAL